jgi:hypothetical protein
VAHTPRSCLFRRLTIHDRQGAKGQFEGLRKGEHTGLHRPVHSPAVVVHRMSRSPSTGELGQITARVRPSAAALHRRDSPPTKRRHLGCLQMPPTLRIALWPSTITQGAEVTVTSGQGPDNNRRRHTTAIRYLREARQLLLAGATFVGAVAGLAAVFVHR